MVSFRFGYFGKEKLKEIKLFVCNIDGCFTNGHIYVSGDQKEIISYDVKDAIGISLLKKSGIEVCASYTQQFFFFFKIVIQRQGTCEGSRFIFLVLSIKISEIYASHA